MKSYESTLFMVVAEFFTYVLRLHVFAVVPGHDSTRRAVLSVWGRGQPFFGPTAYFCLLRAIVTITITIIIIIIPARYEIIPQFA